MNTGIFDIGITSYTNVSGFTQTDSQHERLKDGAYFTHNATAALTVQKRCHMLVVAIVALIRWLQADMRSLCFQL